MRNSLNYGLIFINLFITYFYLVQLGDYVMALVINEFDQSCWVPGIVQTINEFSFPKLYKILYFNGQEGDNSRVELVKINKNLYGFIVNYIRTRLGVKYIN